MNIQKEFDIVCVAQPSWQGVYAKSTVLLMKELAMKNKVLYVDYAYTWKDFFMTILRKSNAPILQMVGLKDRLQVIATRDGKPSLSVLTLPPMLPLNFLPGGVVFGFLNRVNGWMAALSINKAMKRIQFVKPVVINAFSPSLGIGLINKLHERLTLYYCYDEIKEAVWARKHGQTMEALFAKRTDGVIVSSESLKNLKLPLNAKTFVVKNGVDANIFRTVETVKTAPIARPVIGFVGSLDNRIDYKLLEELIIQSPEFNFRFIGRVTDSQFETIQTLLNVEWIAPIDYNQLPAFIQDFEVGLIPFVKSPFTKNIYPLKINEYLAMGKAVVMTSFANLPEFDHLVERADTAPEFKRAIVYALKNNSTERKVKRELFAKRNSWNERAREFCEVIEQLLQ